MSKHTQGASSPLVISNITIRQDANGRYCLNDFHKAAGSENRHRPSLWAENQQSQELISEIETEAGIPALVSVKGGSASGTYVVRELVYAYAMWISPAFHLKVIRAYDALVTQPKPATPLPKSQKALPGGLTLEQQDAVKALVRSRVDVLPKDKQGKAAITCWSSIKSKFQVKTYKEVPPEQFGEVLSLVARLPLEGEHIPAGQPEPALPQSAPVWEGRVLLTFRNGVPVAARALDEDEITLRRPELAALWQGVIQDNMAAAARMALFCEAHSVSLPTAKA
jgi:hypothetical protein